MVSVDDRERLVVIESNIRALKKDVAHGLIEIGKNLIEAKALLKHGEWKSWLENNVGFSQRTAQNYMKLARTFSGMEERIPDLEASKLFLLQEMPPDDRDRFLEENDVASMSVRKMKEGIAKTITNMRSISATVSPDIWKVFDRQRDDKIYVVPVKLLRPIERYEEFFSPRLGEEYIAYLDFIRLFMKETMIKHGLRL